ncbi:hypothetical protein FHS72_003560 [Loktanella ponticola]|uniref:Aminoglycoside phosphotransferase domain-containing protein n=1 Tax=Yoonia ponticola TaxID=1524255 RepID=A0A7W9BNS1_9RHOB|nr:phosphotransferase [Yoonia ponticola]MBB5723913.1 hypothetical protein [Yoonia ponticola]
MIDLSALFGDAQVKDVQIRHFRVFPKSGAERWLLESTQRRPWHLKTWPRANLRARVIYRVAWIMGALGLNLPSRVEGFSVAPESVYAQLSNRFDRLGIFLGTPGPNRKIVVYAARSDRSVFVKIPLGPVSLALVERESAALSLLAQDPNLAPLIPRADQVAGHLAIEDIETQGVAHAALDLREVIRIHDQLQHRSGMTKPLHELRQDWQVGPEGAVLEQDAGARVAISKARAAADAFLNGFPADMGVPCYMAHGDFTRWNVLRAADGSARIIDWELYGLKPRWFDVLHYIVSYHLLVVQTPACELLLHLRDVAQKHPKLCTDWWQQVGFYFCYQSLYYSAVFERQTDLREHHQAFWQLKEWAEILRLLPAEMDKN